MDVMDGYFSVTFRNVFLDFRQQEDKSLSLLWVNQLGANHVKATKIATQSHQVGAHGCFV
jgi:hypothetical protein